jgi:hypothetical protein
VSRPIETSKFAVLAAVSLVPIVIVFVIVNAIATATSEQSSLDAVLPRGFDATARVLLVAGLAVFFLVRLWILMARSAAVEQAVGVMDEAVERVERRVASESPIAALDGDEVDDDDEDVDVGRRVREMVEAG